MLAAVTDFTGFTNKYLSRMCLFSATPIEHNCTCRQTLIGSDVVAIGSVLAIAQCGGPLLSFRGGRVDAVAAGQPGVPEPHQDLNSHIESFRKQGFTKSEMIGLVACGHTFGGIRHADFPEIAPQPEDGAPDLTLFDTTRFFDNTVCVSPIQRSLS